MTTDPDPHDAVDPAGATPQDDAHGQETREDDVPRPHDPWVLAGLVAVALLTLGAAALAVASLVQLVGAAVR